MPKCKPIPTCLISATRYDRHTGLLYWKEPAQGRRRGVPIGHRDKRGYLLIRYKGKLYLNHRVAWAHEHGDCPVSLEIDHKDTERKDDNRIANLRLADRQKNMANSKLSKANTSGFKGVSYRRNRRLFRAYITSGGKQVCLGHFDTAELAHAAYVKAATEIFGEFARNR